MSLEDVESGSTATESITLSSSDSSLAEAQNSPSHEEKIKFVSVWDKQPETKKETKVDGPRSSPASVALLIISSFCCIVLGMLSFHYNKKAFKSYSDLDNRNGDRYARRARIFAWVAIIVGVLITLALLACAGLLYYFQAELPLEWFRKDA